MHSRSRSVRNPRAGDTTLAREPTSSANPSEIRRRNAEMQSPVPKPPHLSDLLVRVNVHGNLPGLDAETNPFGDYGRGVWPLPRRGPHSQSAPQ